jgi:hypothetical protein
MKLATKRLSTLTMAPVLLVISLAALPDTAAACDACVRIPLGPLPTDNADGLRGPNWDHLKRDLEKIIHDRLQRELPVGPCFRSPISPLIGEGCKPRLPEIIF